MQSSKRSNATGPPTPSRIPRRKKIRTESPEPPEPQSSPEPRLPYRAKCRVIEINSDSEAERAISPVVLADIANGSSQEVPQPEHEIAHTNATKTTRAKRATAIATASRTAAKPTTTKASTTRRLAGKGATLNDSTSELAGTDQVATGDQAAVDDQTDSPDTTAAEARVGSKAAKPKAVAKPKPTAKPKTAAKSKDATNTTTASAGAGSSMGKGKGKPTGITDAQDAIFSPNMLVAMNEIVKNHMNARIQADRTSIGLQLALQKTEQERQKAMDAQLGWLALIEKFIDKFGVPEARTLLDGIFAQSQVKVEELQKETEKHKCARAEWEVKARELEKLVHEMKKAQIPAEKADQVDWASRFCEEAERLRNS